ncbi:La-related protein 1 [Geodia barretti]|uniref:La-related protein 1 n=1 Tax=Geodia barretti TaxID=519541 RepID=A0AA35X227_GEOBA|nr:La-related protein 1 [Geodia barretti]
MQYYNGPMSGGAPGGMYYQQFPAPMYYNPSPPIPPMDKGTLQDCIRTQIEYYFSDENLQKDFFLRRQMTHEGYVHLTVIGRFNRVRALTQDPVAIKEAMVGSTFVEMAPDGKHLRQREGWQRWVVQGQTPGQPGYPGPGGFHQFVPPEGYEGGGGISPLTPPFIVGPHGHPLMEGLEVPPEFMPALGIALDSRGYYGPEPPVDYGDISPHFSTSDVESGQTSGIESEATGSEIHDTHSVDRSPPSHPHSTITSGSSSSGGASERDREGKEGGGGGVARVDSGVGKEEWVSVQRKKKPSGGEGRGSKSRQQPGEDHTHRAESHSEDLGFQFDEEFQELGGKKHGFSEQPWDPDRSTTSSTDDEMDDHELGKLLIVTQTSHASPAGTRKHPGGDRTGNFLSRAKVTAEIAKTINDGLYFYEQDLHFDTEGEESYRTRKHNVHPKVGLVTKEEFETQRGGGRGDGVPSRPPGGGRGRRRDGRTRGR